MHSILEGSSILPVWRKHKGSLLQPHKPRKRKLGPEAVCVTGWDLYSVLGIDAAATQADIRHAYRTAVKSCHPDVDSSLDAHARFEVQTVCTLRTQLSRSGLPLMVAAALFRQLQMLTQCSAIGVCGTDITSMAAEGLVDALPSMAAGQTVSPAAASSSVVAVRVNAVSLFQMAGLCTSN